MSITMTTADSIIQQAPRQALLDALTLQASESHNDAMRSGNALAIRRALARVHAIGRAQDAINGFRVMPDISAMIVALNEACRLLGIPAHERTRAVVDYGSELVAIGLSMVESGQ